MCRRLLAPAPCSARSSPAAAGLRAVAITVFPLASSCLTSCAEEGARREGTGWAVRGVSSTSEPQNGGAGAEQPAQARPGGRPLQAHLQANATVGPCDHCHLAGELHLSPRQQNSARDRTAGALPAAGVGRRRQRRRQRHRNSQACRFDAKIAANSSIRASALPVVRRTTRGSRLQGCRIGASAGACHGEHTGMLDVAARGWKEACWAWRAAPTCPAGSGCCVEQ